MAKNKPDALVFGFPRCASTSVWHYLNNHPEVFDADKEPHFWNRGTKEALSEDEYRAWFDSDLVTVDVSPATVYAGVTKGAIEKIKAWNPDIKLICLLRDPIDRTWSDYHKDRENTLHFWQKVKPKEFRKHNFKAVAPSPLFIMNGEIMPLESQLALGQLPPQLGRSLYARYLKPWVEAFDNILFIRFEDLRKNAKKEMRRLCNYMSITFDPDQPFPKLMSYSHMKSRRIHDKGGPLIHDNTPWKEHVYRFRGGSDTLPRPSRQIREILMENIFNNQLKQLKDLTGVDYATT